MPTPLSSSEPFTGHYYLVRGGQLQTDHSPLTEFAHRVQHALRWKILAPEFSCVAARAALNTSTYALACYPGLGSAEATAGLARDLARFCGHQDAMDSGFTSMIAVFSGPASADEQSFEDRLWAQLRALHACDPQPYSPEVSADPTDPRFGFSFNGRGFFVIGLHPHSSRVARTFAYPALVFNAHRQFQALRDRGHFDLLQRAVRRRELRLQGSLNPNLANYGEVSEARQYSGRAVEADWVAPFPAEPLATGPPSTGTLSTEPLSTGPLPRGRCPFGQG